MEDKLLTYVKELNSRFHEVLSCDFGAFDADMNYDPPFVTNMPAEDLTNCFIFNAMTIVSSSKEYCENNLISFIERYVNGRGENAILIWRCYPKIVFYKQVDVWRGYTRLKVLDKNSILKNYFEE